MRSPVPGPPPSQSGYTLIELMFVVIVLAIGILASVKLFPVASREQLRDRMRTAGTYYAQQQVETLRGLGYNEISVQEGRYPAGTGTTNLGPNNAFHRFYTVTDMDDPLPNLKRVSVTVRWSNSRGDDSVVVSTYLGR